MIVQMDYVTLKTNTPSPPALFCEYMYGFTQNTGKQKEKKKKNPKQKKTLNKKKKKTTLPVHTPLLPNPALHLKGSIQRDAHSLKMIKDTVKLLYACF